jgi:predicted kinase
MTNPKLLVLRGLPASGKSTYARELLASYPVGSAVRINNDELSLMLFGSAYAKSDYSANLLGRVRANLVREAFRNHAELVIMDNTNITAKGVASLRKLAGECGVEFELDESFLDVPLAVCLERNAGRENPVPEKVIIEMSRLLDEKVG